MNKIQIALQYQRAIVHPQSAGKHNNKSAAVTLCAEMLQLGFAPTNDLLDAVQTSSEDELGAIYQSLIPELQRMVGDDVKYAPMYPNFPEQVMQASDAELLLNAIVHYLTIGEWTPSYYKVPRRVAFERTQFKQIGVITEDQFDAIFARIAGSNESITAGDKKVLEWFLNNRDHVQFPDDIPFKENLCTIVAVLLKNGRDVTPVLRTATDVLRVAAYLSDGDVSLAEPTQYKSLPRSTRRQLVKALENVASAEDLARYRNRWIKLFHNLHVGDYSNHVYDLASKVRNNEKIQTFNGRVQDALDVGNLNQAVELLEQRPGEFARRLDHLLRIAGEHKKGDSEQNRIVQHFNDVAEYVPTRVLLQLLGHFEGREIDRDSRVVFPKGSTQRAVVLEKQIPALQADTVDAITSGIVQVLIERFSQQESLGNVWVDPQLADCPVPTQMRSASEGLYQVARGTRLPFGDHSKNTLRFFIYWIGQDIDLSASFHDENFNMVDRVAYTNLRSSGMQTYHSGDIVSAPRGASEFIDVTIDAAAKTARYVAMNVLVFSGPSFAEHKKVYAGWMTRAKPKSNEVYDPKTVEQKVDLTAHSRNCIPVVFDLHERKAIWTDLNMSGRAWDMGIPPGFVGRYGPNNVEVNRASIEQSVRAIIDMSNKVSLYELFMLHGHSRGQIVEDRDEADVVFAPDGDVTPYSISTINSEYVV